MAILIPQVNKAMFHGVAAVIPTSYNTGGIASTYNRFTEDCQGGKTAPGRQCPRLLGKVCQAALHHLVHIPGKMLRALHALQLAAHLAALPCRQFLPAAKWREEAGGQLGIAGVQRQHLLGEKSVAAAVGGMKVGQVLAEGAHGGA